MEQYPNEPSSASSASSSSSSRPVSLQSADFTVLEHESSGDVLKEFREFVLDYLLETKHDRKPNSDVLNVLSEPSSVSKIIQFLPCARRQLLKQFLSLEKHEPGFVSKLMRKYQQEAECIKDLPDCHEYGFANNILLGKFLIKGGWYAEALLILQVAWGQAGERVVQKLEVLPIILLAQSYSCLHVEARQTVRTIIELSWVTDLPDDLKILAHSAVSTCYFELGNFDASYREAAMALRLLNAMESPCDVIVDTFRLMARSCIALGQMLQAKLLLTQALSWADAVLGKVSLPFAEALEDYAFYLLMSNSLECCQVAIAEAKFIFQKLYGVLGLRPDLAQGNLAFRLFLECYEYRNVMSAHEYMEFAYDLGSKRQDTEDRQILAIKRIPALIAAANRRYEEDPPTNERSDVFEELHSLISIDHIRWVFHQWFVERNYG